MNIQQIHLFFLFLNLLNLLAAAEDSNPISSQVEKEAADAANAAEEKEEEELDKKAIIAMNSMENVNENGNENGNEIVEIGQNGHNGNKRESHESVGPHALPIGPVVLVTGGAAGIGYNLVNKLLKDPSVSFIIAADIRESPLLSKIANLYSYKKFKNVKQRKNKIHQKVVMYLEMNIADPESIEYGFELVKKKLAEYANDMGIDAKHLKLNTLINNAGIMEVYDKEPGVDLLNPKKSVYMRHLEINAVGAALITGAFHKIMPDDNTGRIVFISSSVGSMNNFLGIRSHRNTAYGMSKAAMNYYMLSIADKKKWLAISICPGWVGTDIGNQVIVPGGNVPTEGGDAAKGIVKIIEGMSEESRGRFYSLHHKDFILF